jgi:hypothetical protein
MQASSRDEAVDQGLSGKCQVSKRSISVHGELEIDNRAHGLGSLWTVP